MLLQFKLQKIQLLLLLLLLLLSGMCRGATSLAMRVCLKPEMLNADYLTSC
jgi:hypothetical protein